MMCSIRTVVALISVCALAGSAEAQAPGGWQDFTRRFQEYVDADQGVGASVVLVRSGKVIGRYDTGMADKAKNRKVDERTIFHWGSITKTLTAIGIMQLRDRGLLSLDDKIVRWVPELRQVNDPFGALDSITVRMLLSHSAGFQNSTWPYDKGLPWEPFEPTTWNQLVAMMPYEQLLFRPGSRYGYSNPAFIYLARIIEQISGDPWDAYVHKNIFAPLGLTHSYFRNTPYYLAGERSHNYYVRKDSSGATRVIDNGPDFDPGITTANGGWNAPLSDLVQYMAFLTNTRPQTPGPARYDVVLARNSLEEMWKPLHPMGTPPADANARHNWMGLSFFVVKEGNRTLLGHTGSQAGYRSFMYFNPSNSMAIIAAFNTTNQASPASPANSAMMQAAFELIR
jgi:CubicO group peptidase (beta-lactamase class C family)